jgi:hypothetical protein
LSGATYELGHEGNHEVEKTDGLDESETENGVGEKLATESGVAGNTVQESGEDETDTDTGTSETNGGSTHTEVLGDLDHGLSDLRGVRAALESGAGGSIENRGSLLALKGLERGGWRFSGQTSRRLQKKKIYEGSRDIPEKVRLLALATWTRRAGRAALVEAEAIWAARRLARTRVEAIVSGGVVLEDRKMG